jgi:hypothetical protein
VPGLAVARHALLSGLGDKPETSVLAGITKCMNINNLPPLLRQRKLEELSQSLLKNERLSRRCKAATLAFVAAGLITHIKLNWPPNFPSVESMLLFWVVTTGWLFALIHVMDRLWRQKIIVLHEDTLKDKVVYLRPPTPSWLCRIMGHKWWVRNYRQWRDQMGALREDGTNVRQSHCQRCGEKNPSVDAVADPAKDDPNPAWFKKTRN